MLVPTCTYIGLYMYTYTWIPSSMHILTDTCIFQFIVFGNQNNTGNNSIGLGQIR